MECAFVLFWNFDFIIIQLFDLTTILKAIRLSWVLSQIVAYFFFTSFFNLCVFVGFISFLFVCFFLLIFLIFFILRLFSEYVCVMCIRFDYNNRIKIYRFGIFNKTMLHINAVIALWSLQQTASMNMNI